jgi:hypothetical protein
LKSPIIGLIDRQKAPSAAFYGVLGGYVINVNWASLQFAPGGQITPGNKIDQAIAQVRQANKGGAHLALKLRVFAGIWAPNWAKSIGGAPFVIRDPSSKATGTVGRFWLPAFGLAYQDLESKLAARYDLVPEIREVTIARCMTIYDEPFIRQIADAVSVANLVRAGYTVAADQACHRAQILAHAVWRHTRSNMTLNPAQYILPTLKVGTNEAFTEQMMLFCRQVLGPRCVLQNDSLRSTSALGPMYDQMYAAMSRGGPNISFQTATMARIGSLSATINKAVFLRAASVELPFGYQTMGAATFAVFRTMLARNVGP